MAALWISLGVVLVLVGVRDAFMTLFQPMGRGSIGAALSRGIWKAARATGWTRALTLAGPLGLVAIVFSWALLVGVGWALILWPGLPNDALLAEGLRAGDEQSFSDALYWSFTVLTTLGFGDITPLDDGLRIAVVAEALLGFGLLTASLAWLLSLTSGVARSRTFACQAHLLWITGLEPGEDGATERVDALADGVRDLRVTLRSQPQIFFFRGPEAEDSVPNALRYAWRLGRESNGPAHQRLRQEVELTATVLSGRKFVGGSARPVSDVLDRFAHEKGWAEWNTVNSPRHGPE